MNIQNKTARLENKRIALFLGQIYSLKTGRIKRIPHGVIDFNYLITSGRRQFIFKIYNTRNARQINFELSILRRLAALNFPSPRLVQTLLGKPASSIAGKPCALLGFIPGRMLKRPSRKEIYEIGRKIGLFHVSLLSFKQPVKKLTWEPRDIKQYLKTHKRLIIAKSYPQGREFISYIQKELTAITFPKLLPAGITHQDIKPENIIIDAQKKIHFIDFDACYKGVWIYDLLTPVIWMCFTRTGQLRKDYFKALVAGYQSVRVLTAPEKRHLYDALRFRLLREAFVWPMRFSPRIAQPKSERFMRAYKKLSTHKNFIESLCKI